MICDQLIQANKVLVQLTPRPSMSDVTRVVCGQCERTVSCPVLTVDQAEAMVESTSTASVTPDVSRRTTD